MDEEIDIKSAKNILNRHIAEYMKCEKTTENRKKYNYLIGNSVIFLIERGVKIEICMIDIGNE